MQDGVRLAGDLARTIPLERTWGGSWDNRRHRLRIGASASESYSLVPAWLAWPGNPWTSLCHPGKTTSG
jgi:hypothetical protein